MDYILNSFPIFWLPSIRSDAIHESVFARPLNVFSSAHSSTVSRQSPVDFYFTFSCVRWRHIDFHFFLSSGMRMPRLRTRIHSATVCACNFALFVFLGVHSAVHTHIPIPTQMEIYKNKQQRAIPSFRLLSCGTTWMQQRRQRQQLTHRIPP